MTTAAPIDWHSPVTTAADLVARVTRVAESLRNDDRKDVPGVSVELETQSPYTNTLARVTAVGTKYGDALLTITPTPAKSEGEMVLHLTDLIRQVTNNVPDPALGAYALAEALVRRGVIPTSAWR